MVEVCLEVILALNSRVGPQADIRLPQCQYDLEAHLGHITTCIYDLFQKANNTCADQPAWMGRLVCTFVVHKPLRQVFSHE